MKPVSKRARRRQKTIAEIVETALEIISVEGFDALTMKRLADERGYAIGAFYRYFPSKDELLLAVQRRVLEELAAEIADADARARSHLARSRSTGEPEASLLPILVAARTYATLGERRPSHAHLLGKWLGNPDPMVSVESAAPVLAGLVELFATVPRLFEEAVTGGALAAGDAQRRGFVLWSALQGALNVKKLDRFGMAAFAQEPLIEELLRALFLGWGAAPETFADAWRRATKIA